MRRRLFECATCGYCQVDEKLVDLPPRYWARARREPAILGIRNGHQPQLDNTPPVARSLEEAGLELLTFYTFPKAMWKSLRTTNALENLNREFRRRTKTQASFSTEAAALSVLFGLVAVGQIVFRKIDGHQDLAAFLREAQWYQAA